MVAKGVIVLMDRMTYRSRPYNGELECKDHSFLRSVKLAMALADLGPVVQSIVSFTSSLRGQLVKCFMTL